MKLETISFDQIDKQKWNGLVHFAKSGNVFGYHWYLKAILHDFDIVIEGDYQSGIPVFKEPLSPFMKKLLPHIGVYTINLPSKNRMEFLIDFINFHHQGSYLSFNPDQNQSLYSVDFPFKKHLICDMSLAKDYDIIAEKFSPAIKKMFSQDGIDTLKITNSIKPEELLKDEKLTTEEKNILYRLTYNAMHRGIAVTSKVQNTGNGDAASAIFFLNRQSITEIYCSRSTDSVLMAILYDYIMRTYAGRNLKLTLSPFADFYLASEMGFEIQEYFSFN
jgi:hypothetical protein